MMYPILLNIALALLLFLGNGWIGSLMYSYSSIFDYTPMLFDTVEASKSEMSNFILKVINPAIYVAVIGAIFQFALPNDDVLIHSLWALVPIYWAIRCVYVTFRNRWQFINIRYEVMSFVISVGISEFVFFQFVEEFLSCGMEIMIPKEEVRNAVWFAIFVYVAHQLWEILNVICTHASKNSKDKRTAIVVKRYDNLKDQFSYYVKKAITKNMAEANLDLLDNSSDLEAKLYILAFSIMIYEDYNRAAPVRAVENILKSIFRPIPMTLGVMQVKTYHYISDEESIEMGISLLCHEYSRRFKLNGENIDFLDILDCYNGKRLYKEEVSGICSILERNTSAVSDSEFLCEVTTG